MQRPSSNFNSGRGDKEAPSEQVQEQLRKQARMSANDALENARKAHDEGIPMFEALMRPPFKHRPTNPYPSEELIEGVIRPLLEERKRKKEAEEKLKAEQKAMENGVSNSSDGKGKLKSMARKGSQLDTSHRKHNKEQDKKD